jgi:hypothetical protein
MRSGEVSTVKVCLYEGKCYWKCNKMFGTYNVPVTCCFFIGNCSQRFETTVQELQRVGYDVGKLRRLKFLSIGQ